MSHRHQDLQVKNDSFIKVIVVNNITSEIISGVLCNDIVSNSLHLNDSHKIFFECPQTPVLSKI